MRRFRFVLSFMIMSLLFTAKNSVYALTIDQLLSETNINLNCPTGYSWDSQITGTNSGDVYNLSLRCVRSEILLYNNSVAKIVAHQVPRDRDPTDQGTVNPVDGSITYPVHLETEANYSDVTAHRWQYLLNNGFASLDDIAYIRALGIINVDTTDSDQSVADMAGRLNVRVGPYYYTDANNNQVLGGGYMEYGDNLLHKTCETNFVPGSFIATTEASWNALPGDALITRNRNLSAIGLFDGAGLTFTHTGMATGPYGVRHLTTYSDFFSSADEIDSSNPLEVHIKPQFLYFSSPGTITENLDGSFCKTDPVNNVADCSTPNPPHRREWDSAPDSDLNTFVLTTSNANTRANLQSALNTALTTEEYYSVYGFANGIYNQNPKHRECATFVRDALISSFGSTTFDSYITTPPLLADLQTLFNFTVTDSSHWTIPYSTDYKSFWYSAANRSAGASGLYRDIFNSSYDQIYTGVRESMPTAWYDFFHWLFKGGILVQIEKTIRQNIGTQIVNCFSFNECDNYQNGRTKVPDPDKTLSNDGNQPFWDPASYLSIQDVNPATNAPGTRPIEEGWTFSPDDVLNFTAYDRMEKINKIPSQTVTSCDPNVNNQSDSCNMYDTNGVKMTDLSIYSCAPNSTCECTLAATCDCSANNHPWLNMNTVITHTPITKQITYDNDRADGNASSILGSPKGPYAWSYTAQIRQTLHFDAWHDTHQYEALNTSVTLYPVDLVEASYDYQIKGLTVLDTALVPVHHAEIPLDAGETLYFSLIINYDWTACCGITTFPHWYFVKVDSNHVPTIIDTLEYRIPPLPHKTSYDRSIAIKFSPWAYQ